MAFSDFFFRAASTVVIFAKKHFNIRILKTWAEIKSKSAVLINCFSRFTHPFSLRRLPFRNKGSEAQDIG